MLISSVSKAALDVKPLYHLLYSLWLTSPGAAAGVAVAWGVNIWAGLAVWGGVGLLLLLTRRGESLRFGLAAYTLSGIGFTYARLGITPTGQVQVLQLSTFDPGMPEGTAREETKGDSDGTQNV